MKPWLTNPYKLHAGSKEALESQLIPIFGESEGELISASHNHAIRIYQKQEPTGKMLDDGEGGEYPEMTVVDGWFADVMVRETSTQLAGLAYEANPSHQLADVETAKQERNEGRYAPITVDGCTFDADAESYMNIVGAVESWGALIHDEQLIEIGMVKDGKHVWTLADNTSEYFTLEQLTKVRNAIRVRAGLLHAQYQVEKNKAS